MTRSEAEQRILDGIAEQIARDATSKLLGDDEPSTLDEIRKAHALFRNGVGKSLVKLLTDPNALSPKQEGRMTALRWGTYLLQLSAVRRLARSSKGFAFLFAIATLRSNLGYKLWRDATTHVRENGWVTANIELDETEEQE